MISIIPVNQNVFKFTFELLICCIQGSPRWTENSFKSWKYLMTVRLRQRLRIKLPNNQPTAVRESPSPVAFWQPVISNLCFRVRPLNVNVCLIPGRYIPFILIHCSRTNCICPACDVISKWPLREYSNQTVIFYFKALSMMLQSELTLYPYITWNNGLFFFPVSTARTPGDCCRSLSLPLAWLSLTLGGRWRIIHV